jgi:DNA integrity scanning protein DisA with diadenylate cyclase activity
MRNYEQVQQQIEKLSETELLKIIDFIKFLNYKKSQKLQRRLAIFEELRTKKHF